MLISIVWFERCVTSSNASAFSGSGLTGQQRAMSLDLEKQSINISSPSPSVQNEPVRPRRTIKNSLPPQTDTKIMIVWLESFEDFAQFPISKYFFKKFNFIKFTF